MLLMLSFGPLSVVVIILVVEYLTSQVINYLKTSRLIKCTSFGQSYSSKTEFNIYVISEKNAIPYKIEKRLLKV